MFRTNLIKVSVSALISVSTEHSMMIHVSEDVMKISFVMQLVVYNNKSHAF